MVYSDKGFYPWQPTLNAISSILSSKCYYITEDVNQSIIELIRLMQINQHIYSIMEASVK